MTSPRTTLKRWLERVEAGFDAAFTPAWNPLYQLGGLGWFFYWIVIASGIYLYIFFDTGITDAYLSVERITNAQWYAGGIMRSFHRYASDALVVVVVLHLLREYLLDRMRGARWFAWLTGVPLLWLIYGAGISGYWLVWDKLAQYVAVATTEWLDTLPLFGEPIARNFLHVGSLSSRFFTLMVFIHIAVPLFLLFMMWLHISRHARPGVNPPRGLALGSLVSLLVLSLLAPVYSQGPANLAVVPAPIELDWYYLAALPLSEQVDGLALWVGFVVATLLLAALPWLPSAKRAPVAVVNPDFCNGCGRCHDDCPFSAVTMQPRSDGAAYSHEAVVTASLCLSCGICTGACPTATPFRRHGDLVAGIEQPPMPTAELRQRCLDAAQQLSGDQRVMVFGCEHGVAPAALADDDAAAVLTLPCVGMLPPSFIDFVLSRRLADGVLLTGCREGDCHFRLGIRWTQQRIARQRDPLLRARVPVQRLRTCFSGINGAEALRRELHALRAAVKQAADSQREHSPGVLGADERPAIRVHEDA